MATMAAAGAIAASCGAVLERRRRRRRGLQASLARRNPAALPPGTHRLSVVVPAYRELRIAETVHRLRAALVAVDWAGGVEIVVVDDGSGDDTELRAVTAGADQVIVLPRNRGKGAAVRAGMLAAGGRVVAFTDADLSYSPDQIVGLLEAVESGWDVVMGSREHERSATTPGGSRLRRLGHRAVAASTRLVLAGGHTDTQCGLKAFRADAARGIFSLTRVDRFAFDIEVLHLVERHGLSATEVPVFLESSGHSTVRVGRDALRLARDLARIRWWSRRGHYDTAAEPAPSCSPGVHRDLTDGSPKVQPTLTGRSLRSGTFHL